MVEGVGVGVEEEDVGFNHARPILPLQTLRNVVSAALQLNIRLNRVVLGKRRGGGEEYR